MSVPIAERIARYHAWLDREPMDRPLIGLLWEPDIPPLPEFLQHAGTGKTISPDQIEPQMFLPHIERWYRQDADLQSDVIQPFTPAFGVPWVEAIAGCPVVVHPGSLWAAPCLDSYARRPPIRFDRENPWLCKLVEFTHALVELADGRFPVALPQMRGPLDTLAAMRTPVQMSLDLIETPDQVVQILDELTDLWIGIAEAVLDVIPPFHGGYCTRMKLWAPGKAVTPQNDTSSLISRGMYEEFVLPFDQRIVGRFPYHSFHVHSTEHHQVDALLKLEELTAIQLTLEHTVGGPPLTVTLPVARRILAQKPLLLAAMDLETADLCLDELPTAGLCLMVALNQPNMPSDHMRWLEKHCHP